MLAGARNPAQVRENAAAGRRKLSAEIVAELNTATAPIKDALGSCIDLWQAPEKARTR